MNKKKNNNSSIVSTVEGFARMLRKSYTNVQSTISGRKLTDRVSIPIAHTHTYTHRHEQTYTSHKSLNLNNNMFSPEQNNTHGIHVPTCL